MHDICKPDKDEMHDYNTYGQQCFGNSGSHLAETDVKSRQ